MLLMIFTFVTLKVIIEQQFQEEIWGPQDFMEQHLALDHQVVHSSSNSFPSRETISFWHMLLSLHFYSLRVNYDLFKSSTLF